MKQGMKPKPLTVSRLLAHHDIIEVLDRLDEQIENIDAAVIVTMNADKEIHIDIAGLDELAAIGLLHYGEHILVSPEEEP